MLGSLLLDVLCDLLETNCPRCRKIPLVYTIVPGQVEKVAKQLGIVTHKVYGNEWHTDEVTTPDGTASPAKTMEASVAKAIKEAKSWYNFQDEDDDDIDELSPRTPSRIPVNWMMMLQRTYVVLEPEDGEGEDSDSEEEDEAYIYKEEEEEDLSEDFLSEVDEIFVMDDPSDPGCVHPDGFVPFSAVPDIVL